MGLFNRKPDPISDRARALSEEIAALEAKIKALGSENPATPKKPTGLRSTAIPGGSTINHNAEPAPDAPPPKRSEPIFEPVDKQRLTSRGEATSPPEHFNELGVRKYDLPALLRRLKNQFSGPSATNPKLVNYLAAGGIQGLRPMRYEKRIARNRFIFLVAILFIILFGIIVVFFRN